MIHSLFVTLWISLKKQDERNNKEISGYEEEQIDVRATLKKRGLKIKDGFLECIRL